MSERSIDSQVVTERSSTDHQVLAALAADLDLATRVSMRLRPDGLVEVVVAGDVVGFIDHVAPVFVALSGPRPAVAVEVAQRRTLPQAVEALRSRWDPAS